IKRDLEGLAARGPAVGARLPTGPARETRIERVSQMRKTIARRLTESKRDIPHYYLTVDVDAAPLLAFRKDLNTELEASGEKVSVNDVLIKGCATALRRFPA